MEGDEQETLAQAISGVSPTEEPPVAKPSGPSGAEPTEPPEPAPASPEGKEPVAPAAPPVGGEPAKPTVEGLLKDGELGPQLQSWADRAAAAQVKAALEQERAASVQTSSATQMGGWASYFSQFSQEELAEVLAQSPDVAAKYAEVQQYQASQQQAVGAEQVATAAQVYAYAHQIRTFNSMLEASDLPQEKRDELKPENFTHLGAAGVNEWGKAVYSALLASQVDKAVQEELKTKWEAYRQEHLAELGVEEPPLAGSGGSPGAPKLDLIKTPSEALLEAALTKKVR